MTSVKLYLLAAADAERNCLSIAETLGGEQTAELQRYKEPNEKYLRLASSYLLARYTPASPLTFGKYGKPEKAGAFFNVSHSGGYAALALAETEVGVDIEKIRPVKSETLSRVLSAAERGGVSSSEDFFKLWTAKESLLKCVGSGLIRQIKDVPSNADGEKTYLGEKYYSRSIVFDGHAICVTLKTAEPFEISLTKCGLSADERP